MIVQTLSAPTNRFGIMTVTTRDLLSAREAVEEAAWLVGATVSGHYLGVYLLTV